MRDSGGEAVQLAVANFCGLPVPHMKASFVMDSWRGSERIQAVQTTHIGAIGHRISSTGMARSHSHPEIIMMGNGCMGSRKVMGSMCGKMAMSTLASGRPVLFMAGAF